MASLAVENSVASVDKGTVIVAYVIVDIEFIKECTAQIRLLRQDEPIVIFVDGCAVANDKAHRHFVLKRCGATQRTKERRLRITEFPRSTVGTDIVDYTVR